MSTIKFTVDGRAAAYLRWLSRNIVLEKSVDLVARHLVMQQIERLRRKYHRGEPPLEYVAEEPPTSGENDENDD